jgi:hypothetical protein
METTKLRIGETWSLQHTILSRSLKQIVHADLGPNILKVISLLSHSINKPNQADKALQLQMGQMLVTSSTKIETLLIQAIE